MDELSQHIVSEYAHLGLEVFAWGLMPDGMGLSIIAGIRKDDGNLRAASSTVRYDPPRLIPPPNIEETVRDSVRLMLTDEPVDESSMW